METTEIQTAHTLRDAAIRLTATLDALQTYKNVPGVTPPPAFEKEKKRALKTIKECVATLLPKKAKAKRQSSPEVTKWKSDRMKVTMALRGKKEGTPEYVEARAKYDAWMEKNPSPSQAKASKKKSGK